AHPGRISIAFHTIVHGTRETFGTGRRARHGLTQIICEGRDSAAPGQITTQECDALRGGGAYGDDPFNRRSIALGLHIDITIPFILRPPPMLRSDDESAGASARHGWR